MTERVNHPLIPNITDQRLDQFLSGPYATQNFQSLLDRARYDDAEHVQMSYWSAPGDSKPSFQEGVQGLSSATALKKGHRFGPSWTNHWVKVDLKIPKDFQQSPEPVICTYIKQGI